MVNYIKDLKKIQQYKKREKRKHAEILELNIHAKNKKLTKEQTKLYPFPTLT